MRSMKSGVAGVVLALAAIVSMAAARPAATSSGPGHLLVVRMIEQGTGQFRFAPATLSVQPGDTVRWLESSGAPHNVQFDSWPKGARLGASQMGPLLTSKGAVYQVVIDGRFPPGTYAYECTPHGALGMKAVLTVVPIAP